MEELGVGGFMGIKDVKRGMKVSVMETGGGEGREYKAEVAEVFNDAIMVTALRTGTELLNVKGGTRTY